MQNKEKEFNFQKIEQKWQKNWDKAKIFEANPDKRKKFFITFPYPYMNGSPHIGHLYSMMRAEVFARYKRMKGFNVLFPQGWHCTGSPIVAAARRVEENEKQQIQFLKDQGFSAKEISSLKKPENWTKVFPKIWAEAYDLIGVSYDKRRTFITTSLNPYYDKFVRWQFKKLKEGDYIGKGKHPVVWDTKTNMPVGDHDRIKGEGETPQEFVLLKFKYNNSYLVAATLRPETIFGQTNLWINPNITYVKAKVNNEEWILSKECIAKLKEQEKKVEIIEKLEGKYLLGKYVQAPGIDRKIIILPANFVNPDIGTGIVTSVPSDSPYDYIALKELQSYKGLDKKYGFTIDQIENIEEIEVIPIIKTNKYGDKSAVKVVEDNEIISQNDKKLDYLTQEVYKEGYHNGIMLEICGRYSGMKVNEAKEKIKEKLLKNKEADMLYDLTSEVVSRSLTKCIVKIVSDQWFIKYSNKEWKNKTHEALKNLKLYPEVVRDQFSHVIDWLNDWACTREYGLGTRLPFDEKWLIESLSDSTVYMAYYTIAHLIKDVPIEKVDDELLDYIFLNKGKKPNVKNIDKIKEEFEYWYPVDFRNSGKDLVQNHLTFFLFNHVAIFPQKYWPKGIGVNGWVKVEGEKMSKSLGNILTLKDIAKKYGADASRITILSGGEGLEDTNWDGSFAEMMKEKLTNLHSFILESYNKGRKNRKEIDNWMDIELNKIIEESEKLMEVTMFRSAIQKIYFDLQRSLKWYLKRTEPNKDIINRAIETQLLLLSPFAPYLCEELWEKIKKKRFISIEEWPKTINVKFKGNEEFLKQVINDVKAILKLVKIIPKKIYLYVIPKDLDLIKEGIEFFEREFNAKFSVYAVNDKNKYDPQNKAQKAKPGKPAIFVE
ncbi:leucine--tRNA ligase [Candidatus Woesearchaeota archaeon]|nr:leucine--tRNA ligase [Candidatus Woesearchaeota archaeon]